MLSASTQSQSIATSNISAEDKSTQSDAAFLKIILLAKLQERTEKFAQVLEIAPVHLKLQTANLYANSFSSSYYACKELLSGLDHLADAEIPIFLLSLASNQNFVDHTHDNEFYNILNKLKEIDRTTFLKALFAKRKSSYGLNVDNLIKYLPLLIKTDRLCIAGFYANEYDFRAYPEKVLAVFSLLPTNDCVTFLLKLCESQFRDRASHQLSKILQAFPLEMRVDVLTKVLEKNIKLSVEHLPEILDLLPEIGRFPIVKFFSNSFNNHNDEEILRIFIEEDIVANLASADKKAYREKLVNLPCIRENNLFVIADVLAIIPAENYDKVNAAINARSFPNLMLSSVLAKLHISERWNFMELVLLSIEMKDIAILPNLLPLFDLSEQEKLLSHYVAELKVNKDEVINKKIRAVYPDFDVMMSARRLEIDKAAPAKAIAKENKLNTKQPGFFDSERKNKMKLSLNFEGNDISGELQLNLQRQSFKEPLNHTTNKCLEKIVKRTLQESNIDPKLPCYITIAVAASAGSCHGSGSSSSTMSYENAYKTLFETINSSLAEHRPGNSNCKMM